MTKQKIEFYIGKASEILKYVYIIHIILAFCSYTADSWITGITPLLVITLGGLVLVYRLVNIKEYKDYPFIWLYVLFVALYGVSSIINIRYGFVDNLKIMVWMTIQFGTLYLCDMKKDRQQVTKELLNCLRLMVLLTTIMNLIGIGMLFTNYCDFWTGNDDKTYLVGIAYWGRLYGIHTDPNYGAVQTIVAIVASVFLFAKTKNRIHKILYAMTIVVNMMHLTFGGSRTGLLSLMAMAILYAFIYVFHTRKNFFSAIIAAVVCVVVVFGGNQAIATGYNSYVEFVKENDVPGFNEDVEIDDELIEIGREEEINEDISNRRFDLWNNAIQVMVSSPILGTTFANLVPYCMDKLPDSYLISNDYAVFDAFHNMFMDLLASQGILGAMVFLGIIVLSLRYLWIHRKKLAEEDKHTCCFLFSLCAGMIVSSLFVSEILYVHNQVTVLFWLMWGFLMYFYFVNVQGEK